MSNEAIKEASDGSLNEADDGSVTEFDDAAAGEACCCDDCICNEVTYGPSLPSTVLVHFDSFTIIDWLTCVQDTCFDINIVCSRVLTPSGCGYTNAVDLVTCGSRTHQVYLDFHGLGTGSDPSSCEWYVHLDGVSPAPTSFVGAAIPGTDPIGVYGDSPAGLTFGCQFPLTEAPVQFFGATVT